MKVRITNMKAPWPQGSGVGAVVSIDGEVLPGWAGGKCIRIEDGAKADFDYEPATVTGDGTGTALPPIASSGVAAQYMGQAQAFIDDLRAKHDADIDELRKQNDASGKALQEALDAKAKLSTELAAAKEDADGQRRLATDLRAKLDDAEKAAAAAAKTTAKKA